MYLLVIISGDPILYRDGMIYFKTESVEIKIKRLQVVVLFNILSSLRNTIFIKIQPEDRLDHRKSRDLKHLKLKDLTTN